MYASGGLRVVTATSTSVLAILVLPAATGSAAGSGTQAVLTERTEAVSVNDAGVYGNRGSAPGVVSAGGRYVAFGSGATNLAPGGTNGEYQVYVRDRRAGTTSLVSASSSGEQATRSAEDIAISGNGRYVAFSSYAANLVPGDTNNELDVFVHDRTTGTTSRASAGLGGAEPNGFSDEPQISSGRYVVFESFATNLVAGDTNATGDVFVRDLRLGTTRRVSLTDAEGEPNSYSFSPAISADGATVSFSSFASNLMPGDTNDIIDVFVRDLAAGTTTRVSVASSGTAGNGQSLRSSLSRDGGVVAFTSSATNLVRGDTNDEADVFVHDRPTETTSRVNVSTAGEQAVGRADTSVPSISGDGRYVAFQSTTSNLVADDTNERTDAFRHDRQTGTTTRVSIGNGGNQSRLGAFQPDLSLDGRFVVFWSLSAGIAPGDDTNRVGDVFIRSLPPPVAATRRHR